jgi:hypothetical protein
MSGLPRKRHPLRGRGRAAWTGLLVGLVFLGALDLHPAEGLHGPLAAGGQTIYFATGHSGRSLHLHTATTEQLPRCLACLLRLQTRGIRLCALALSVSTGLVGRLRPASGPSQQRYSHAPLGARGPPLA